MGERRKAEEGAQRRGEIREVEEEARDRHLRVEEQAAQGLGKAGGGHQAGDDEAERENAQGDQDQRQRETQRIHLQRLVVEALAHHGEQTQGDHAEGELDQDMAGQDGQRRKRRGAQPLEDAPLAIDRDDGDQRQGTAERDQNRHQDGQILVEKLPHIGHPPGDAAKAPAQHHEDQHRQSDRANGPHRLAQEDLELKPGQLPETPHQDRAALRHAEGLERRFITGRLITGRLITDRTPRQLQENLLQSRQDGAKVPHLDRVRRQELDHLRDKLLPFAGKGEDAALHPS